MPNDNLKFKLFVTVVFFFSFYFLCDLYILCQNCLGSQYFSFLFSVLTFFCCFRYANSSDLNISIILIWHLRNTQLNKAYNNALPFM